MHNLSDPSYVSPLNLFLFESRKLTKTQSILGINIFLRLIKIATLFSIIMNFHWIILLIKQSYCQVNLNSLKIYHIPEIVWCSKLWLEKKTQTKFILIASYQNWLCLFNNLFVTNAKNKTHKNENDTEKHIDEKVLKIYFLYPHIQTRIKKQELCVYRHFMYNSDSI